MNYEKVFPTWVWLIYLLLFSLSIPWYLPSKVAVDLVFGLPLWLVTCIMVIVIMALFTIWIANKYWKD